MKYFKLIAVGLLLAACDTSDPEAQPHTPQDGKFDTIGNCSFIPGCTSLLEAADGPFYASIMDFDDQNGLARRQLSIVYRESPDLDFLLCSQFPRQPDLTLTFVVGPEDARESFDVKMRTDCPRAFGDNPGASNSAVFSVFEDEDPMFWEELFPPARDGTRWFALQVAAVNENGQWDSLNGNNYRLLLDE